MFSARLFGGQEEVFDFLEGRAERVRLCVQALIGLVEHGQSAAPPEKASRLCGGYLGGLEREDVEALAGALDGAARAAEKTGEHLLAAPHLLRGLELSSELVILKKAAELLCSMIGKLREGVDVEGMMLHIERLQRIEGEAERRVLEVLRGVYASQEDVFRALFLKELTVRFEAVLERCGDAGQLAARLVMRNSQS